MRTTKTVREEKEIALKMFKAISKNPETDELTHDYYQGKYLELVEEEIKLNKLFKQEMIERGLGF